MVFEIQPSQICLMMELLILLLDKKKKKPRNYNVGNVDVILT